MEDLETIRYSLDHHMVRLERVLEQNSEALSESGKLYVTLAKLCIQDAVTRLDEVS
jgi:hypothetical protein